MYFIVYQTLNGLKARYLTTHVFLTPGDKTLGGWKVLSVGYYYGKKFIDKKTYFEIINRTKNRHLKYLKFKANFSTIFNILLKILLTLFLLREVIYKFFIYILS